MGKYRNIILTAREDHLLDSPNRKPDGPKIHFDLSGYDILLWKESEMDSFREELEKKIRRRQAILEPPISEPPAAPMSSDWFRGQSDEGQKGLVEYGKKGFMEAKFALEAFRINLDQRQLLEAASKSVIRTFGWPIGVVMTKSEYRPRPMPDGIVAKIMASNGGAYDYWALGKNGDFYLLRDLFEDTRKPEQDLLFVNTRIVQVTEVFLYAGRLYSRLGVAPTDIFEVVIRHGGLKGRRIAWATRWGLEPEEDYACSVDESISRTATTQSAIENNLTELVKSVCDPMFTLFNFYKVPDASYQDIVSNFVAGRVS